MGATLYGSMLSPHVAKVVLQIRHKGLDIPLAAPPGGIRSEDHLRISPLGKIPSLDIGGRSLFESRAICEYLEMTETAKPMWSSDPVEKAHQIAIASIADLYISENALPLFPMLNPEKRVEAVVKRQIEATRKGFQNLETVIGTPFAAGEQFTLADCSVAPYLYSAVLLMKTLGQANPLSETPKVSAYWADIQDHPIVKSVFDEMNEAVKPYFG